MKTTHSSSVDRRGGFLYLIEEGPHEYQGRWWDWYIKVRRIYDGAEADDYWSSGRQGAEDYAEVLRRRIERIPMHGTLCMVCGLPAEAFGPYQTDRDSGLCRRCAGVEE